MKKLKTLCYLDDKSDFGGGQMVLRNYLDFTHNYRRILICNRLSQESPNTYDCESYYSIAFPNYPKKMRFLGVQLLVLPLILINVIRIFFIWYREKPSLVIVNSLYGMIPVYILSFVFEIKILFIAHNSDLPKNNAVMKLLAKADKIACVSTEILILLKSFGIHNCEVIHNGVDLGLTPEGLSLRQKFFTNRENVFVFVGRLSEEKNIGELIKAFALYNKSHQNNPHCLLIIGDGPLGDKLKALVDNIALNEYIKFAGFVDTPQRYMSSFDALFLVSLSEGMPLVLLEAFSQHLPVIGTPVQGISEFIVDGSRGLLSKGTSAQELLEVIEKFSSYTIEERKMLTNNGYKFVKKRLAKNCQKKAFIDLVESLLEPA